MCSAVVDLPEPPFSLPITSTCARSDAGVACAWAMLGLGAGWKPSLIRTAGLWPAHGHEAGQRPAVRKTMSATEWRAPSKDHAGFLIQTAVSWNTAPPLGQPG